MKTISRYLLLLAVLLFFSGCLASAQTLPPATQVTVSTNDWQHITPDDPTSARLRVQYTLDKIDNLFSDLVLDSSGWDVIAPVVSNNAQSAFDWLDNYLNISTNNFHALNPTNSESMQVILDDLDDYLTVYTNGWDYLNPTNVTSLQAFFDAVDTALAPTALTASQIGISTNNLGGLIQYGNTNPISGTNTVQDALDALNRDALGPNHIYGAANQSAESGFYVRPVALTASYTNTQVLAFTASTSGTSFNATYFVPVTNSGNVIGLRVQPAAHGLLAIISTAMYGYSADGIAAGDAFTIGINPHVPFGTPTSGGGWYEQAHFVSGTKYGRAQMDYVTVLNSNSTFVFDVTVANTTGSITSAFWGSFAYIIGTTATPTP